jgi:hypothetical protein
VKANFIVAQVSTHFKRKMPKTSENPTPAVMANPFGPLRISGFRPGAGDWVCFFATIPSEFQHNPL